EVVLAEEYAFEAERPVQDPEIEIARDQPRDIAWVGLQARAAQLGKEFKYPGFDHCGRPFNARRRSGARTHPAVNSQEGGIGFLLAFSTLVFEDRSCRWVSESRFGPNGLTAPAARAPE